MKNSYLIPFFSFFIISCGSIYQVEDVSQKISKHSKIAILPFQVHINLKKLAKGATYNSMLANEVKWGYTYQEQMYFRFLRKKKHYKIKFQDINTTNVLLLKNNINSRTIKNFTKAKLCKLLKVDAIVSGTIVTSKPMSELGAIIVSLFFRFGGFTNKASVNLSLYNRVDNDLLFNYQYKLFGGVGSSSESISRRLMKKIEYKFPYRE